VDEQEEPLVPFWNHVWVSPADANRLHRDYVVYGNCFVKITRKAGARVEGERIDPLAIAPVVRGDPR
jgi:hypothetical protein